MKSALGGAAIADEILAAVAARTQPSIPSAIGQLLVRADEIIGLDP